ncbi:mycofactocin biosynthesis chaperone MftB [Nocardia arizonensis]|uniref:mycofactocin biosynthesis chaperone MftB n=1 Tax=Nocardia arizonensis TaxID=1141647 RepID=UPI0006CF3B21|nr:mycofactocin biosynthesis chaperone MftB [Nocardia arizonensis]
MSTDPAAFDPTLPYTLAGSVSLRPEPFGALVYDYATRRLSFLKTPRLVTVVRALEHHADAFSALTAADVPAADHDRYLRALRGLCESGTIHPRRAS